MARTAAGDNSARLDTSHSRVQVSSNNAGTLVFEGNLDGGGRGILRGLDPVGDKIVAVGD
jgi:hypothetical protein